MPTLTVIVGLPGSGKTSLLGRELAGAVPLFVDDFHAGATSHRARDARRYGELIEALRAGRDCAVADIAFTAEDHRTALEGEIRAAVPGVTLVWVCFEENRRQCILNILGDVSRPDWESRVRAVLDWYPGYTLPDHVVPRRVHPAHHLVKADPTEPRSDS